MKVKNQSELAQSCLTLRDRMDCSPPGSSIHGIFQARGLDWGATAFSAAPHCVIEKASGPQTGRGPPEVDHAGTLISDVQTPEL